MGNQNIYQKLIEVRKSVSYLKKDNKGYQFQYVSSSQTLGTLRGKMDELGLLLVPSVLESEIRDHTTDKGKHEYFTAINIKFTWINAENPEERVESMWIGQGLDSGEKGVGKALTYAEKYFLLKFFNIATDKDDPDSFQNKFGEQNNDNKPTQNKPASQKIANKTSADWEIAFESYFKNPRSRTAKNINAWRAKNKAALNTTLQGDEITKFQGFLADMEILYAEEAKEQSGSKLQMNV